MAKPLEYNATLARRVDLTDSLTIFTVKPEIQEWVPAETSVHVPRILTWYWTP